MVTPVLTRLAVLVLVLSISSSFANRRHLAFQQGHLPKDPDLDEDKLYRVFKPKGNLTIKPELNPKNKPLPEAAPEAAKEASPKPVQAAPAKKVTFVDDFVISYWAIVIFILAVSLGLARKFQPLPKIRKKRKTMRMDNTGATVSMEVLDGAAEPEPEQELAESMWSMNLVAAASQAKLPRHQYVISPLLTLFISVVMAMSQVFTIFLVVDSMDPMATPITTMPATPWKDASQAWTVNCMKWMMITFLGMGAICESRDAMTVFMTAIEIDSRRLSIGRWLPLFTPCLHYFVTMGVVTCGVSVILSCQDVPSILYNSLAICFINELDGTFCKFFHCVFGIESDFLIVHKDLDNDGVPDVWVKPLWVDLLERFVVLLPTIYAFFLVGRAWHTNQSPAEVFWAIGLSS